MKTENLRPSWHQGARRRRVVAGVVSGLFLGLASLPGPEAYAQTFVPGRTVPGGGQAFLQLPGPPVLQVPGDGEGISAGSTPSVSFRWSPPGAGPRPNFYFFEIGTINDYYPNPNGYRRLLSQQVTGPGITIQLPNGTTNRYAWRVTACIGGVAPNGVQLKPRCGQAATRTLTWNRSTTAPALVGPAQGSRVPSMATFEWRPVPSAGSYLVCVSAPGATCPTSTFRSDQTIVRGIQGANSVRLEVDLSAYGGRQMNWTVAACDPSSGHCTYQPQFRSIVVEHPPRNFLVSVDRIYAYDNCDRISDGDWIARLDVVSGAQSFWSQSKNMNVGDNAYTPGVPPGISGVRPGSNDSIAFGLSVVDCDSDNIWNVAKVGKAVYDTSIAVAAAVGGVTGVGAAAAIVEVVQAARTIADVVGNFSQSCGGEEWLPPEITGKNDFVGVTMGVVAPQQLRQISTPLVFSLRSGPSETEEESCAPGAFLADITVRPE